MKFQLALPLAFYLLHCSFGAIVIGGPDVFCGEGPPGKYCLPDLSGWHDCQVDPRNGKMVDKVYSCPANTRCACFDGPACPGFLDSPCQPYKLPPQFPGKFTLYYDAKKTNCLPKGCSHSYYSGREMQVLTEHKQRDDLYANVWSSAFVHPGNGSAFSLTAVLWDEKSCNTVLIKTFPETQIPPYFSYNGTVKIGSRLCEKWIWKTGGHKAGEPSSLSTYYISNQTEAGQKRYAAVSARGEASAPFVPVMLETFTYYGPVGKGSSHLVLNITSFVIGVVDEELLDLPSFC